MIEIRQGRWVWFLFPRPALEPRTFCKARNLYTYFFERDFIADLTLFIHECSPGFRAESLIQTLLRVSLIFYTNLRFDDTELLSKRRDATATSPSLYITKKIVNEFSNFD